MPICYSSASLRELTRQDSSIDEVSSNQFSPLTSHPRVRNEVRKARGMGVPSHPDTTNLVIPEWRTRSKSPSCSGLFRQRASHLGIATPGGSKCCGNLGHEPSHPQSSNANLIAIPLESCNSMMSNRRRPRGATGIVRERASAEYAMQIAIRIRSPSNSTGKVMTNVPPEMINILYRSLVSANSIKPYSLARPIETTVNDHSINTQDAPNARENTEAAS